MDSDLDSGLSPLGSILDGIGDACADREVTGTRRNTGDPVDCTVGEVRDRFIVDFTTGTDFEGIKDGERARFRFASLIKEGVTSTPYPGSQSNNFTFYKLVSIPGNTLNVPLKWELIGVLRISPKYTVSELGSAFPMYLIVPITVCPDNSAVTN